ncbi:MAG: hypothetical protein M3297_06320 [Thermoproteota archaeon]|nr:hypothetical protein [Thermoproteota archaeon]
MDTRTNAINDWQTLVNKPVYANDGKEVGIVRSIQSENLVVDYGPLTSDHFLVPKTSVRDFENGIVYLNVSSQFVESNYKYE